MGRKLHHRYFTIQMNQTLPISSASPKSKSLLTAVPPSESASGYKKVRGPPQTAINREMLGKSFFRKNNGSAMCEKEEGGPHRIARGKAHDEDLKRPT